MEEGWCTVYSHHGIYMWSRVAPSLQRVSPYHIYALHFKETQLRSKANTKPIPLYNLFFGQKLQNEKLATHGATHVIAVDGFSQKVFHCITIHKKNSTAILIWFTLQAITSRRSHLGSGEDRSWHRILPHFSSAKQFGKLENKAHIQMSTNNHRVERLWPEINHRVNYPIQEILEASRIINTQDENHSFMDNHSAMLHLLNWSSWFKPGICT